MKKLPFELKAGEAILREEDGVWIRGGLSNQIGRLYLTNQRLVFSRQNPVLMVLFGLLGALFSQWFRKVTFDLPLKDVTGFEHTSYAFNKRVILFRTLQGEQKFGVNRPYEEWEPVLKKALKK